MDDVYCPYFSDTVSFNSNGFHHLKFSGERKRNLAEYAARMLLFKKYAAYVLRHSGTVQEYRELRYLPKRRYTRHKGGDLLYRYWAFVAIVGSKRKERIKVIVRQRNDGTIHFWSIMRAERHKGDESYLQ
jgi:hypothetical protein